VDEGRLRCSESKQRSILKAIDIKHAEIGQVSSRKDGALRFAVITPELTLDQRATMLGLHGINVRIMVEALDVPTTGIDEVSTEMDVKTPCKRLYDIIFVHWKDAGVNGQFRDFYHKQMDRICEGYKSKNLPPIEG
jgi:hypothetical protein